MGNFNRRDWLIHRKWIKLTIDCCVHRLHREQFELMDQRVSFSTLVRSMRVLVKFHLIVSSSELEYPLNASGVYCSFCYRNSVERKNSHFYFNTKCQTASSPPAYQSEFSSDCHRFLTDTMISIVHVTESKRIEDNWHHAVRTIFRAKFLWTIRLLKLKHSLKCSAFNRIAKFTW